MNKYISKFMVTLAVAVAAISYPVVAEASVETFTISKYSESFVPAENSDAILKCLYGDYMKLPPEKKRRDHQMKVWADSSIEI